MQNKDNTVYGGFSGEPKYEDAMKNYNTMIIHESLVDFKLYKNFKVVDFGAGIGSLSLIFREKYKIEPICIEIDEINKKKLSEREFQHYDFLRNIKQKCNLIFSSNVLEHIEDDITVFKEMKDQLLPKGKIYLYLPARMILWTQHDVNEGHYRRYEIKELKSKCANAGLKIERLHYSDFLGFFALMLTKIIGYNSQNGLGSYKSIKFYNKFIFPFSRLLDKIGFKYILGKNIILVAVKK